MRAGRGESQVGSEDNLRQDRFKPAEAAEAVAGAWSRVPLAWRLTAIALLGVGLAAIVGALTASNPQAAPAHLSVAVRVALIGALIAAGIYAQTSHIQTRMGWSLVAVGLYASVWLLNGSRDRLLFAIGATAAAVAQLIIVALWLAHPTGTLRTAGDRRVLAASGLAAALWVVYLALTGQPPLKTGLMQCAPHCPSAPWSLHVSTASMAPLRLVIAVGWVATVISAAVVVGRRAVSAPLFRRPAIRPMAWIGAINAGLLIAYLGAVVAGLRAQSAISAAVVECVVFTPLAILLGLFTQRMFMGHALADLVTRLAAEPDADPETLMAEAIRDPSLRIAYARSDREGYVDSSGTPVTSVPEEQTVSWFERDGKPVAAVMYSRELADQAEFVAAAGAGALMRIEQARAEAELKASTDRFRASRARLVEGAQAERRRIERDLHDGVQQQLLALRLKLDQAAEAAEPDPEESRQILDAVGRRMDDLLNDMRAFARGIYPAVLQQQGVGAALKSAAMAAPVPADVDAVEIGRYPQPVEVAVYFCCLEALQNVAKHGGPSARASTKLWEDGGRLCFEVRDDGVGFDTDDVREGSGLTNMRERIDALGGGLEVISQPGSGTLVRGYVPGVAASNGTGGLLPSGLNGGRCGGRLS